MLTLSASEYQEAILLSKSPKCWKGVESKEDGIHSNAEPWQ